MTSLNQRIRRVEWLLRLFRAPFCLIVAEEVFGPVNGEIQMKTFSRGDAEERREKKRALRAAPARHRIHPNDVNGQSPRPESKSLLFSPRLRVPAWKCLIALNSCSFQQFRAIGRVTPFPFSHSWRWEPRKVAAGQRPPHPCREESRGCRGRAQSYLDRRKR